MTDAMDWEDDWGAANPAAWAPRTEVETEDTSGDPHRHVLSDGAWNPQQIIELHQYVELATTKNREPAAVAEGTATEARPPEAGPNFHQTMVFLAVSDAPEEAELRAWAPLLLLGSWLIVLLQVLVSAGVYKGTMFPSCQSNDMCGQGQFCLLHFAPGAGTTLLGTGRNARCSFCDSGMIPLDMQLAATAAPNCNTAVPSSPECPVMNNGQEAYSAGFNLSYVVELCKSPRAGAKRFGLSRGAPTVDSPTGTGGIYVEWEAQAQATWCKACFHDGTGTVADVSPHGFARMAVKSMHTMDWLALVFASILLGLTVNNEMKVS
jgi:hypothetical protein